MKDADPSRDIWARWGHWVVTHPLISISIAACLLIPMIIPVFTLQLGIPDNAVEPPDTQERQSYDLMTKGFGVGSNGPFLISIELPTPAEPSDEYTTKKARAEGLKRELKREQYLGKQETKRLTREGDDLNHQKRQIEAEATPLVAQAEALARQAEDLARQGQALEAVAARLEATATHLESQLRSIAQTAEKTFQKLNHPSDPDKRERLEQRLRRLEQRAAGIIRHLEHLRNEGERLQNEKTQLKREAAHLAVEARRLEQKGIPVARSALQLEQQGKALERKVDRAKESKPRKRAHAHAQLARARGLKHELTHMLIHAGGDAKATDPRLVQLQDALEHAPGVDSVSPPSVSKQGTAAIISLNATAAPAALETEALVTRVRTKDIPQAIAGTGLTVYVGGETASYVDLAALITEKLPMIIGIVIALAFILLLLAFRSIAIPLSAGVMNLVSVAASYGILVAIFQWGWGLEWLGYGYVDSVPIASYVPLMMFAVLFGLSMDYEVFLMSQIIEHHNEGENDHDAVISGISRSARIITSAALIMVAVFASFILYPNPTVKQFGVGLSVAVAIDATIVRILLVPAVMSLMGGFNWWLPKWLDRIL
ncbi:MAG: MMPL family transporter, partial [Actinomycetota bacterium]